MPTMENQTIQALLDLRSALDNDPRILQLAKSEEALSASEEITSLKKVVDEASERYSFDVSHFGEESENAKASLHELFLAKKSLDEHPLSRQYNADYSVVRKLYGQIDSELIGPYRAHRRCEVKKC